MNNRKMHEKKNSEKNSNITYTLLFKNNNLASSERIGRKIMARTIKTLIRT